MSGSGIGMVGRLSYRIPSLSYRILVGALWLVPTVILLVGLPAAVLASLGSRGISLPFSVVTVSVFGFGIAVLGAARSIGKPTRLYGPLSIALGAVEAIYLLVLLRASPYVLSLPGTGATLGIGYASLILALLVVPLLSIAAGSVTTLEDARHPRERLPFDYPV
ncbi:MAG TPA: hypothetical protein VMG81_07795 [Thermoplasmata archaeon]|nr:hypothetical protein [Thermoplasmata archaeon]